VNFQSESKRSGDEFEDLVLNDLRERGFLHIKKNVYMPGEAKGGRDEDKKRPGAQRTDNVKKAIANGSLIKAKHPSTYYVVYFSAKPITKSYSAEMIDTALCYKIIDEVRYITDRAQNTDELVLFKMDESEAQK
jgi:hypothetical protein